jgi:hypothetical protein
MTEFEMAYLLADMQASAATGFGVALTVSSGFLIAGYTISHRLNLTMVTIIVALYTWYSLLSANILIRQQESIFGLVRKIQAAAANGQGLEWHAAYTMPMPSYASGYTTILQITFSVAMWAGAIAFFFLARHANLKRERDEAAARATPPAPDFHEPPSDSAML